MLFSFLGQRSYPIGIDMAEGYIKLVQLNNSGKTIKLIAGTDNLRPDEVVAGSCQWQSWAIEIIKMSFSSQGFKGRNVVVSIPPGEVFIDHVKMPKCSKGKLNETVLSRLKQKLPFDSADAIVKCVETEQDNLIVFVTEHEKINRHLAVYEKNNLQVKSICIWPMALTNCYGKFFGRRQSDADSIVLLVDIGSKVTNVVISRYMKPLFARSILIGSEKFGDEEEIKKFIRELEACRQFFSNAYNQMDIERMVFLSGQTVDKDVCATIAKQIDMPAQMGDCLGAVELSCPSTIERRGGKNSWATAFGLSLS